MTFEEQAYKEREMFAKLNKLRNAQSESVMNNAQKGLIRQDYAAQKNRTDELVSFRKSQTSTFSSITKHGGIKKSKNKGSFTGSKNSETYGIVTDKGAKETLSPGYNWDSGGYQERAKPTVLEQQGLLNDKPSKVPSLLRGRKFNGRHTR